MTFWQVVKVIFGVKLPPKTPKYCWECVEKIDGRYYFTNKSRTRYFCSLDCVMEHSWGRIKAEWRNR